MTPVGIEWIRPAGREYGKLATPVHYCACGAPYVRLNPKAPGKCAVCNRNQAAANARASRRLRPPRALTARDKQVRRSSHLKTKYGLTAEAYDSLLQAQNGVCAICARPESSRLTSLSVDHDHKTGNVRGLLCYNCNTSLGKFRDDPALLRKAAAYLEVERA